MVVCIWLFVYAIWLCTAGPIARADNPAQTDVDHAIRRTAAERGEELGVRYQVDWKLKFAYAVDRGLQGLDGLSSLYVDYRALTDRLFAELTINKFAIENSARDWPAYYAQIEAALALEPTPNV